MESLSRLISVYLPIIINCLKAEYEHKSEGEGGSDDEDMDGGVRGDDDDGMDGETDSFMSVELAQRILDTVVDVMCVGDGCSVEIHQTIIE